MPQGLVAGGDAWMRQKDRAMRPGMETLRRRQGPRNEFMSLALAGLGDALLGTSGTPLYMQQSWAADRQLRDEHKMEVRAAELEARQAEMQRQATMQALIEADVDPRFAPAMALNPDTAGTAISSRYTATNLAPGARRQVGGETIAQGADRYQPVVPGGMAVNVDQLGGNSSPIAGPQPGHIEDGYRFRGGDPSDANNWEPVGGASGNAGGTFPRP